MVRCWKRSEECLEEEHCTVSTICSDDTFKHHWFMYVEPSPQDGAPVWSQCPHKVFWIGLSALLLLLAVALLGSMGHLWMSGPRSQSSHIVRISAPDQNGVLFNQSAVVDQLNELVTFSVTAPVNQTSTVLFDVKQGLICYKPVDRDVCFLQTMERSDFDNVNPLLNQSTLERRFQIPSNETQRQTEFLGVLAASRVNVSSLEEPVQVLCRDRSIHWTRRADGPGKQRLVYFCIDICFPSNICVSVCFYYLPE
ncbi:BRICHOS domain-containing protein 5 isoform X2 [Nothobranchius furzeri]|uniref:BRICHOS domain-containing protein 5 isoform X2 n=1 Tax=Nothobranchius furzeri TaxID=105023 RepID=UPI002403B0CA|nr:BRICHOS domain-containing protein 5 isoform X2 [Nothobranchius furzeri]